MNVDTIDSDVQAILNVLEPYKDAHPQADIRSYRQNFGSIRVRIVDPDFGRLDKSLRHDLIWEYLELLPEDIQSQMTVLLLITPEETKTSIANMDFENPIPSRL